MPFENIPLPAWAKGFDLNLVGGLLLPCQEFGPAMCARGKGSIITIATVTSRRLVIERRRGARATARTRWWMTMALSAAAWAAARGARSTNAPAAGAPRCTQGARAAAAIVVAAA